MTTYTNIGDFKELDQKLHGKLHLEESIRTIYATDASAYRELPLAVCIPENLDDLLTLVQFAREKDIPLIPRTAGTSLAGQVVGKGIVVDVSKNFTKILEVNTEEGWVRVEPGVIRDELNMHLKTMGFLFGPETSTANRAMIGGMIGNNSCGSNSVVYGSTRDQLLSVDVILSDGTRTSFKAMCEEEFNDKCAGNGDVSNLEQNIYQQIRNELSDPEIRREIEDQFPKKSIPRRNTGYAVDLLKDSSAFGDYIEDFNFCKLIAGSEGTLALITEAKLKIHPLPPKVMGLLALHFDSIHDSLLANLEALKFSPSACELIDHYILDCTKGNIQHRDSRFFVQGEPKALLVVELRRETEEELKLDADRLIQILKDKNLGYHYPLITGDDSVKVWNLRKAGLGLLSNMPGDAKPVPVIEDTAVDVQDLPQYIREFNEILASYDLFCVHYAHAGSGELHLRPILNLKTEEGTKMFKTIAQDISLLVKKYKGSLSGEHGDGRLRGQFIPQMIGEQNYELLKRIKKQWDPQNIFNPGKIVDTPAMDKDLRYFPGQETRIFDTYLSFEKTQGMQRATELCNGSGDCRKTELSGGTMCPSYMATREEKDTTRARANMLREALSFGEAGEIFRNEEVKEILDLCLSCKGCTSECPSNVDMARLKAEYMSQYYDQKGAPLRSRLIAQFTNAYKIGSRLPWLFNFAIGSVLTRHLTRAVLGISQRRELPKVSPQTMSNWYKKNYSNLDGENQKGSVLLFADEFTNYNDSELGITAIRLLSSLGYKVQMVDHPESGRTHISKGFLKKAGILAVQNVGIFSEIVSKDLPLIGLEPSAILTFRDEYPDLVSAENKPKALQLAENCFTFEEFLDREIKSGNIKSDLFTEEKKIIQLHGHCHQKSLSSLVPSRRILSLPVNYEVQLIPSGCCGMAGSFGFEKEHYNLSMDIGELVLFPTIRKANTGTLIAAAGTSCRHQILDGTGRQAQHPVMILWEALKK